MRPYPCTDIPSSVHPDVHCAMHWMFTAKPLVGVIARSSEVEPVRCIASSQVSSPGLTGRSSPLVGGYYPGDDSAVRRQANRDALTHHCSRFGSSEVIPAISKLRTAR